MINITDANVDSNFRWKSNLEGRWSNFVFVHIEINLFSSTMTIRLNIDIDSLSIIVIMTFYIVMVTNDNHILVVLFLSLPRHVYV